MATINESTNIDNNTANSGAGLETRLETLWQNDQALNAELIQKSQIIDGAGHAPTGTVIKNKWIESTTDSAGICTVAHGLGTNILGFDAYISDGFGAWVKFASTDTINHNQFYNATNVSISIVNPTFYNKSVRILVQHK